MNKFWLGISLILGIGCSNSEKNYMVSVDNIWDKSETKKLDFNISDSQLPKNIIFIVRNNNDYPYSNLFLISTIKGDKGEVLKTDTLQYLLAKPNGEWLGSGLGSVKEILFQYKNNFKFPTNGKYQVEIKHGMRVDKLKGIEDIGIKIESIKTTP